MIINLSSGYLWVLAVVAYFFIGITVDAITHDDTGVTIYLWPLLAIGVICMLMGAGFLMAIDFVLKKARLRS